MPDPPSKLAALIAELRHRRVFRVAIVYAGVAFIIFQIVDATFDVMGIPDWLGRFLIVVLLLGFLVAVGMAWAFDLTAEGLVRAKVKREPTAAKATPHIVIGNKTLAVIAVLAVIAAAWSWWDRPGQEAALGAKSIVVLPFANYSKNEGDWFSDGITEEIITHLSKIGDLKVISRTSAMQYKGTDKSLRQIGEELGVAAILEGSVRRAGGKLRITGQLIDPRTDAHLWAESYNREEDLAEIFAIQSDVARQIAAALKATLTPEEKSYVDEKPTTNTEAYDYYLKGNAFFYRIWLDGYKISLDVAIPMYEKAIELDPDFALAWARLAMAHLRMYNFVERTPERLAKAKSALDRAQALNPDHPEVHLAHGVYYYFGFNDWESALELAELGLKGQPNNAEIINLIGLIRRRQGKWEEAAAALTKAAELDPRHVDFVGNIAGFNRYTRNWAEAERYADYLILMWPEISSGYTRKALVYLGSRGDIEKARGVMQEALEKVDPSQLVNMRSDIELFSRDYQKALDILDATTEDWSLLYKARIHRLMGRQEQATAYYDSARIGVEKWVGENPDNFYGHGNLGIAYAGLGRREEAVREGKLAVAILPLSKDAYYGTYPILYLATIYTLLGEQDAAIEQLELLLSIPSDISVPLLRIDPLWDPLREHPRFKALVAG